MDTISSLALCTVLVHLAGRFIFFQAFLDFLPQNRWKKMALSFRGCQEFCVFRLTNRI